jgi:hypothetical protein
VSEELYVLRKFDQTESINFEAAAAKDKYFGNTDKRKSSWW